jgi:hypothetical protein
MLESELLELTFALARAHGRHVTGGAIAFGLLAFYGLRLIYRAWIDDTQDWLGHQAAPRWMYAAGGCLLQVPFIAYILFVRGMFAE